MRRHYEVLCNDGFELCSILTYLVQFYQVDFQVETTVSKEPILDEEWAYESWVEERENNRLYRITAQRTNDDQTQFWHENLVKEFRQNAICLNWINKD